MNLARRPRCTEDLTLDRDPGWMLVKMLAVFFAVALSKYRRVLLFEHDRLCPKLFGK